MWVSQETHNTDMANWLQKAGKWIFNIKEADIIRYPLDEELIRRDNLIKGQQQQIQARDAQLAKIKAQNKEEQEADKTKDYNQEIAERLGKREEDIKSKRFKYTFSLRYLFNKMGFETKPTKFGRDIDLTDKDDKVIFGKLGDFIIADNGYLVISDSNGEILSYGKDLTQIIWKPDALSNYMKRKRIPLAVDEDLNPVPDLEEEEHPDVIYDSEEDEYAETEVRMRPVKEMLIERDEKIRELQRKLERSEKAVIGITHKLGTADKNIRLWENRANLSSSELSSNVDKVMQIENKISSLHADNTRLRENQALQERRI